MNENKNTAVRCAVIAVALAVLILAGTGKLGKFGKKREDDV